VRLIKVINEKEQYKRSKGSERVSCTRKPVQENVVECSAARFPEAFSPPKIACFYDLGSCRAQRAIYCNFSKNSIIILIALFICPQA